MHTEILLPDHAPTEYKDRAVLWNAVEKIEKYKTAQLSREIEIALPVELTKEQNISLVREYVKQNFVDKGMCADVAIHDTDGTNPHAHIMLTMRPIEQDGTWGQKSYQDGKRKIPTTDWNEQTKAEEWRAAWAEITNRHLEKHNHAERIDHRSYARQGIDKIPTIHLGAAASQMEKRGIRTERGNINREIEVTNQKLRQLKAQIVKLQKWVKEEAQNTESPTLADIIQGILYRREREGQISIYNSINNLKQAAKVLNFLTTNNIKDMVDLEEKVTAMYDKQFDIRDRLKPVERRIKTLDEHLKYSGNFKAYRGYKAKYDKLYAEYETLKKAKGFGAERKAQKALEAANDYRETHHQQITLYNAAERHLRDVMQERFDIRKLPPITKWTAEREKLTADKSRLNREYVSLKSEVNEVYKIQRSVKDIMQEETRTMQRTKSYDMER